MGFTRLRTSRLTLSSPMSQIELGHERVEIRLSAGFSPASAEVCPPPEGWALPEARVLFDERGLAALGRSRAR